MTAHLVRGDARRLPLATGSVQAIVTSPPFWNLRSYGGQLSLWGGDPSCEHDFQDVPAVRAQTGGTGPASVKQGTHKGNNGTGFVVTTATCSLCQCWRGELGSEPTPALFVAHLVEVFREVKRVLRDDGVCFLNIGDSYAGSGKGPTGKNGIGDSAKRQGFSENVRATHTAGIPQKSLRLVPERLAIALSDDGWIIRSRIAWCKAAPMPESVDDRPTSAWEHIWQLTKSNKALFWTHRDGDGTRTQPAPDHRWRKDGVELTEEPEDAKENGWKRVNLWRGHDYYWDANAVRVPHARDWSQDNPGSLSGKDSAWTSQAYGDVYGSGRGGNDPARMNPAGANMRNSWLLGPDPYSGSHFATYPRELVRRCVAAATSEYGACAACGATYRRLTETKYVKSPVHGDGSQMRKHSEDTDINGWAGMPRLNKETVSLGWAASCHCGPSAGVRPCVVADPFSGSGTTAFVAASMGRVGVGVELSAEYTAQARYGRLAQDFLPLTVEAPQTPATPARPAERPVGMFDEIEVGA